MLVRSRQEAALIRDALTSLNIPSVYLSNRDSVFETLEAQEMLWVLQAVLAPERESTLRSALASSMLGLNARDIDALNCDEAAGMRWSKSLCSTASAGKTRRDGDAA